MIDLRDFSFSCALFGVSYTAKPPPKKQQESSGPEDAQLTSIFFKWVGEKPPTRQGFPS